MPETFGSGGGFLDYDGDGRLDVALVSGRVWPGHGEPIPALQLYRNRGDGTFISVTEEVGLGNVSAYGFGITAADYDNDGDTDIFVTTLSENLLFRNDAVPGTSSRVFTEVARAAGLADHADWSTAALFFDADLDGRLDLYVANYVPWTPETDRWCASDGTTKDYCTPHQYEGAPGRFYRNNGDGTFSERTEEAGLAGGPGKSLGVAEMDFDADGWSDFVVANDTGRDLLYRNQGDGTFEEIGLVSGIAFAPNGRALAGMGIDIGVVDATGEPTIVIGNFSDEMVSLYRHQGHGVFTDRSAAAGVGIPSLLSLTFGLVLVDLELDADLDLLLANGHIIEDVDRFQDAITYRQRPQLFLNDGNGAFSPATDVGGGALNQMLVGRGLAYGDYDGDGDLDLLVTENGGPVHLWRNELRSTATGSWQREASIVDERGIASDSAHFLRLRLEGVTDNRDAFGARITAVSGKRRQERRVRSGGSYLSHSESTVTFGLGAATVVDSLIIRWPGGDVDVFERVAADQELRLVQGERTLSRVVTNTGTAL